MEEVKAALELYKPINFQPKSKPSENEHNLQVQCVEWFRLTHKQYSKLLFAIPNGGKRNVVVAKKLKSEGVVAGVPDLFLAVPSNGYFGMFIEMKYGNNTTTDNQKEMIELLEKQNYKVVVCNSFYEFKTAIHVYLKDGKSEAIWKQEQGNRSEFPNNWKPQQKKAIPQPKPEPVFFDFETFKKTLQPELYEQNTFIQNLFYNVKFPFEVEDVTRVIELYRLGTVSNGQWKGAITFPFIDINNNVRAIQVKQFDKDNHTTATTFLHSIIEKHYTRNNKPLPAWLEAYNKNDTKVSCLFGEHLLSKYPRNPVALVEAPKTAIYCTLYFGFPEPPDQFIAPNKYIWLAVYNKSSFTFDKLKVLQKRFVYVFSALSKDGSTFKEWETKAKEYERRLYPTRFIFSDFLEQLAPEQDKIEGKDLADYLIKHDWRLFRKHNTNK